MATQEFRCLHCGGAITFDSALQKMKCPYCDSEFDLAAMKNLDDDLKNEQPDNMKWDKSAGSSWRSGEEASLRFYACNHCGGEIVGDETLAASQCPYCSYPVVMKGQFSGELRPDYVIPFKLDKEAAKQGLQRHLRGKPFLPKVFKDQNHIDEIKGVYVPFWLFDVDATGRAHYKATKIRTWSNASYYYTETSHFSLLRAGGAGFDNIPVDGSAKMADDLMESIEPYSFAGAVDFQTAYLSGFFADRYDVNAEQSVERANKRVKKSVEDALSSSVRGYTGVRTESCSVNISNGKAKYALYPVWLLNTTWREKQYTFAMNGQTGKFVGDLPIDKASLWKWRGILAAVCTLVAYVAIEIISWLEIF